MNVLYIVPTEEDARPMRDRGDLVHVLGGIIEPIKGLGARAPHRRFRLG